jgi:hypothetical protein
MPAIRESLFCLSVPTTTASATAATETTFAAAATATAEVSFIATTATAETPFTAATATPTASETATTTASLSSPAFTFLLGPGLIDIQGPSFQVLAVQTFNGGLSCFFGGHFDKSEAFGPAAVFINDDGHRIDLAEFTKGLLQIFLFNFV